MTDKLYVLLDKKKNAPKGYAIVDHTPIVFSFIGNKLKCGLGRSLEFIIGKNAEIEKTISGENNNGKYKLLNEVELDERDELHKYLKACVAETSKKKNYVRLLMKNYELQKELFSKIGDRSKYYGGHKEYLRNDMNFVNN